MTISNAAGENILNADFRGDTFVNVTSYWLGFRHNGVELTDGDSPGYARTEIVVEPASFGETTTTMIQNAIPFSTPPTGNAGGTWLEADEVVLYDDETAGNLRYSGLLDQPFTMQNGQVRTFAAGSLRIRFI